MAEALRATHWYELHEYADAAPAPQRRRSSASESVLSTSPRRAPPRRAVATESCHVPEPAHRVRVGRADDLHARRERFAHVARGEIEPVRQAVHLQRDAGLERDLEDPLQVERVLGPVVEDPALRMREAAARPDAASPRRRGR